MQGIPNQKSPLSDSNRRPLPYHGRVRVSRAFMNAVERARNPCKFPQCGVYGCGGRFAVVVDLLDAEWTRCAPPSGFRISRADTGPRRTAAADIQVRPMRPDEIDFGSATDEPNGGTR